MISSIDFCGIEQLVATLQQTLSTSPCVEPAVREILLQVQEQGDAALFALEEKFDHVALDALEVSEQEIADALDRTNPAFLEILQQCKQNIVSYHKRQINTGFVIADQPGIIMGQRVTPLDRVGLYVPGGTACYPSSVLMNALPAKLAGVGQLVMTTPPNPDGSVSPFILAAAHLAGVNRIFKIGGAQAIAALAYGTQTVPCVDKIVGPGNIYVATAKQMVYGKVAIDMIAGPSEILIIADETANPRYVAADLLSQAEHDPLARALLLTTSAALAGKVQTELELQLATLKREAIARQAIDQQGVICVVPSIADAVAVSNAVAPEHLELCVDQPFSVLSSVTHAGSIFLGNYTPEALGDYFAGPNHVLPTGSTARFSSPLSVDDFCKKSSFLSYSRAAIESVGERVATFAEIELLTAHANAVRLRCEEHLS